MDELTIPFDELDQVREKYDRGGYSELEECLEEFLKAHAFDLPGFKRWIEEQHKMEFTLDNTIRHYIREHKSVSTTLDMKDQMKEIRKEKWFRGERHEDDDIETVCREWIKKYGEAWRLHRVREILYVYGREKDRYMGLIQWN